MPNEIKLLFTKLSPTELQEAEVAHKLLADAGISLPLAVALMIQNYKPNQKSTTAPLLGNAIAQFLATKNSLGDAQQKSLKSTLIRLRDRLGEKRELFEITEEDLSAFLDWLGVDLAPKTRNLHLNNLSGFFNWTKVRMWIDHSPAGAIGTRKIVRSTFAVMTPESARVLMHDVEANHMELVPYFALTLFGAVRPGVREAECAQFDAALRRGESPILDGGVVVSVECGYTRLLPWTQPLRAWLAAYPFGRELLPGGANAAAAEIRRIRLKHNLGRNVLRHTGITGMALVLDSLVATALACGASEKIIRWLDLAWTKEQALEFYSIAPKSSAASGV